MRSLVAAVIRHSLHFVGNDDTRVEDGLAHSGIVDVLLATMYMKGASLIMAIGIVGLLAPLWSLVRRHARVIPALLEVAPLCRGVKIV